MSLSTNEWIASVASVATEGRIDIHSRDPFEAVVGGLHLQSFFCESAELTVLDMFVPIAEIAPSPEIDHWIARIAPKLFNVHVAIRELNRVTVVEVRSTLIADRLTVEGLQQAIVLLRIGVDEVRGELGSVLKPGKAVSPQASGGPRGRQPSDETTDQGGPTGEQPAPVVSLAAGYL
jgi:hypothetical protein